METTDQIKHRGPHPGMLALIFAVLFIPACHSSSHFRRVSRIFQTRPIRRQPSYRIFKIIRMMR